MRSIFCLTVTLFFLCSPAASFGFATKGEDCGKCHTLKKEEAVDLLKEIVPSPKVIDIRIAPTKAMWEVDVEVNEKKAPVYIDFTKRYLFSGKIVDLKTKRDLTEERFSELNRVDVKAIPLKDALIVGDKSAKHPIIVFSDPDCPFCAKLHEEMKKIVQERKDIAFFIKMDPLPMHKEAYDKAKAIVCEKSLALLEDSYNKKPVPKPKCKTTVVDDNIALAKKLRISGLPAMVLPDGRVIPGFRDAAAIKALIDKK